ncbi:uncharacterized protein [Arachis hypogaea]|uniref:uncharacterized protein n=1 Tax=Arachis hypogaea TaxID=3818 RepID=UPI003B211E6D
MELVDLELNDRKFTWFRGQSCSRIDRVLVSVEWVEEFPETRWHKEKFDDIELRINKLEDEIWKVDELVSNGCYDATIEARRALVSVCKKWYVRKENYWKQMSRSRHAKHMDKKTRYLASARRRSNHIDALVINGRVVRNQARIKLAIRDFCKNLYHQEASHLIGFRDGLVNKIHEEESAELERMPSIEEIKDEEIGSDFTKAVIDFFQSTELPRDSNVTWVVLAPKFVEGREIKDLWLISMWLKTSKKRLAIIKLDFQKAYDRVKWTFVDIVLQKMAFGQRWRGWIKECICMASMLVLINGSPSKSFKMERGLRQGDPLSPFLFVLVADVLYRMFSKEDGSLWKKIVLPYNDMNPNIPFSGQPVLQAEHSWRTFSVIASLVLFGGGWVNIKDRLSRFGIIDQNDTDCVLCDVLDCSPIRNYGLFQEQLSNTSRVGHELLLETMNTIGG